MKSEAVKILKAEYLLRAINEHKRDQAIIFCRTKLDCDNMERYLIAKGDCQANVLFQLLIMALYLYIHYDLIMNRSFLTLFLFYVILCKLRLHIY